MLGTIREDAIGITAVWFGSFLKVVCNWELCLAN